jgi:hypothetical protein
MRKLPRRARQDTGITRRADAIQHLGCYVPDFAGGENRLGLPKRERWQHVGGTVVATLTAYAAKARDIGGDIGNTLVSAYTSAENAGGKFVKTGKLDFRDLVTSMFADLAKLAA